MKGPKDLIRDFKAGRVSRREFVERAAEKTLGLAATFALLSEAGEAHPKHEGPGHAGHHHAHDHAHSIVADAAYDPNQTNLNPFAEWLIKEDIPVYHNFSIMDLRALELKPWKRMGGSGAHIDLVGGEGVNCAYVCELPGGASTNPQRYLFEEVIYVLDGDGETQLWSPGGAKFTVKWHAGSVLGPPLNLWRQHFNRGNKPARLLSVNNAPVVIDLFHNNDFVFNNDHVFRDRFDEAGNFLKSGEDKLHMKAAKDSEGSSQVYTYNGSFVENARTIGLKASEARGAFNSRIEMELADNTMQAHISEFGTGSYKKAHRHGPGSHVVMLNGKGYTLMWKGSPRYSESQEQHRVDWIEGSLFVPPDGWFHQHFNTGPDSARYIAPNWGGDGRWFMRALGGGGRTHLLDKTSIRKGGNMIEYADEDPQVREMYLSELEKSGIPFRMNSKKKKDE